MGIQFIAEVFDPSSMIPVGNRTHSLLDRGERHLLCKISDGVHPDLYSSIERRGEFVGELLGSAGQQSPMLAVPTDTG